MILLNLLLAAALCFFGGTLVLLLALLLARGRAASYRHLIFTGAFAVLLLLPLALWLLPSQLVWQVAHLPPPDAVAATPVLEGAPQQAPLLDLATVLIALLGLWAMGVIFHLSKALFGSVMLMGLYRHSVPHIPEGIADEDFRGLNWQLRLRTVPGEAGPITFGLFKPVVLLPKTSVTWPRARLKAVLLHEAAHVRRKDCLTRLIVLLACALYWPNPLIWIAARRAHRDGETAADDCVLSSGFKASAYAEHLIGLARAFSQPLYGNVSLAMAEPAMLDARIEAILNPQRSRKGVTRKDVCKIAALGLSATAALALIRPSLAEPEAAALCTIEQDKALKAPKSVRRQVESGQVESSQAKTVADSIALDARKPIGTVQAVIQYDSDGPSAVGVTLADAPVPPAAPLAMPAPVSAPVPVPAVAPVPPPAPPVPPQVVRVTETGRDGKVVVRTFDIPAMKAELRAGIGRAMAEAKRHQAEAMRASAEEVRKAVAAARVEEKVAWALQTHHWDMKKMQNDIKVSVSKALAEANISATVADALREARKTRHIEITVENQSDEAAN